MYGPSDTLAHRLDPRTKLAVQVVFAATGFAHTTSAGLVALGAVAAGCPRVADAPPVSAFRNLRYAIPFLALGPVVEVVRLGAPWFDLGAVVEPALASVRVLLVFFVAATYIRTIPVRESRAAIQLLVPDRFGVVLSASVAPAFRFLPLVRRDLHRVRETRAARLGSEGRLDEWLSLVAAVGLRRSFVRADILTLTLRTRHLAWNLTLPGIWSGRRGAPGLVLAAALLVSLAL